MADRNDEDEPNRKRQKRPSQQQQPNANDCNNSNNSNNKVVRTVSVPQEEEQEADHGEDEMILPQDEEDDNTTNGNGSNSGGFVLECQGGDRIRVSARTAAQLDETCVYFRNAFRHGTQESRSRVISKPDWHPHTARYLLRLIEEGTSPITSATIYRHIQEAAQQILLPLRVKHPVLGHNMQHDYETVQLMADTWNACTTTFDMDLQCLPPARRHNNNASSSVWDGLLKTGTVFVDRHDNGLIVELVRNDDDSNSNHQSNAGDAAAAAVIRVGSFAPLDVAVYHTCTRLSEALRHPRTAAVDDSASNEPACLAVPLYLGARQRLAQDLTPMMMLNGGVGRNGNGNDEESAAVAATAVPSLLPVDANTVPTVEMTRCCAPLEQLQSVLQAAVPYIAPVHLAKLCYLLIPKPSCERLGKLIRACQTCQDNPGTMGWDLEKNQFCTLKTLNDTLHILDILLNDNNNDNDKDETPRKAAEAQQATNKEEGSCSICLVTVDMTSAPEWSPY